MRIQVLLFSLILALPPISFAQPTLPASTQELAQNYVAKRKNKALMIGVIREGAVAFFPFGRRSATDKSAPDAQTIFELGGATSVFTTSFMYYESLQGRFDLGDPIQFYVPQDVVIPGYVPIRCVELPVPVLPPDMQTQQPPRIISCAPDPHEADICIAFCDLASHTAGLPNSVRQAYNWNPFGRNTGKNLGTGMLQENFWPLAEATTPANAPGRFFSYSNYGIALLGNTLAALNQLPFDQLMHEQMLQGPLNLKNTSFDVEKRLAGHLIPGHNHRGKSIGYSLYGAFAPAAGLRSSAADLLQWVYLNMQSKDDDWSNAFDQVQQARFDVPFRVNGSPTLGGFGWLITNLGNSNLPVTWINGGTDGFRCFIGFNRDTQTGVVLLSNSTQSVDDLAWDLLKGLLDE